MKAHTVGPASKDVPESTIAAQPPSQTPEKINHNFQTLHNYYFGKAMEYKMDFSKKAPQITCRTAPNKKISHIEL